MRRLALFLVPLAVLSACSTAPDQRTASPATVVITTTVAPPPVTVTVSASPASSAAAQGEYPKFVPKSSVDKRYFSNYSGDKVVMLAPGVYAEAPPDGQLGALDDYTAYRGNCSAIKRYSETRPGGSTCWG
ncbi:hypothetical protein ACFQ68_28300 [Amycolatopsis japonica]|uniref:hypothetical protein n=1 Tax=Amycolatopsis japonica TaxID=208439 RepID=UPI00366C3A12